MHAIKDEFEAYGWRRMQAALRQQSWVLNHKKVKRLMREHGLQPPLRRRFVVTTDSNHDQPIFADRAREFTADEPDQLWVADLSRFAAMLIDTRQSVTARPRIPTSLPRQGKHWWSDSGCGR